MEQVLELVSALKLDTEFLPEGVKHKRHIPKPRSSQSSKAAKKRKRPNRNLFQIGQESPMQIEEESLVHIEERSPTKIDAESSLPIEQAVMTEFEETWDIEPSSIIGQGAFGIVRFERRRPQMVNHTQTAHNQVRAVKEIRKLGTPDYIKELQAVAQFSQAQYELYFVQSYGWFENQESVFITMEYLRLGDLSRFRDRNGPFPEQSAGLIVRQVLEGIRFMHEINFAHRDLKPGNILVASTSPWAVKIADFGISKQCNEGTQLQTQLGTPEYMAPEQKGHFRSSQGVTTYSLSVDIWAIGVIAMELILAHPFLYPSDQEDYTRGIKPLEFNHPSQIGISESCQDFVKSLLTPNPIHRPSAEAAISHSWFAQVALWLNEDDSLFVQDEAIPSQRRDAATASPMPLLSWSTFGNLRLTNRSPKRTRNTRSSSNSKSSRSTIGSRSTQRTQNPSRTSETEVTILDTYQGRSFDVRLLASSFRHLSLDTTKYFVLRSDNEADMELCFAQGRWTALPKANKMLDNGYRRSGGNVLIFFSVVESRKFYGIAKMTSPVDWNTTDPDWVPRPDGQVYHGRFTVDWVCLNELSFDRIKGVPAYLGKGRLAVAVMDGQAICPESGYEILRAYSEEDRRSPCSLERRQINDVNMEVTLASSTVPY
ncbi:kinase-like protein [Lophium mytilinum]|uniref:Kinase-like protein n=1 Tax=Lophium mytilinum TaxID=390894 RepID=A0A6A6R3D5_9PEZI|nr:kinase-like protein [Lophium mytilinum]